MHPKTHVHDYQLSELKVGSSAAALLVMPFTHISLGLALLALFIVSFIFHAFGGVAAHNETALQHGQETMNVLQYVGSSQFWFESLQNWQSEFLAVGTLLVLSIYLRERGSQQSKPVGARYDHKTGE